MKKTIMLLAVLGSFALAGAVQANTLTLANGSPQVTGTGPFTWNYSVLWSNSTLFLNDFVSLTGAQGITSATAPAGWLATITGGGTGVTWEWIGGTTPLGAGQGTITGFTLVSSYGTSAIGGYNSQDHVFTTGLLSTASGSVFVPAVITVPDGGSAVAFLGIALAGIEAARRMFRVRKA